MSGHAVDWPFLIVSAVALLWPWAIGVWRIGLWIDRGIDRVGRFRGRRRAKRALAYRPAGTAVAPEPLPPIDHRHRSVPPHPAGDRIEALLRQLDAELCGNIPKILDLFADHDTTDR